jgi:hypothetical protein
VTVDGAEVVLLSGGRPGLFMHASLSGPAGAFKRP